MKCVISTRLMLDYDSSWSICQRWIWWHSNLSPRKIAGNIDPCWEYICIFFRDGRCVWKKFHTLKVEEPPLSSLMMHNGHGVFFIFCAHTPKRWPIIVAFPMNFPVFMTQNYHFVFSGHNNLTKWIDFKGELQWLAKLAGPAHHLLTSPIFLNQLSRPPISSGSVQFGHIWVLDNI